MQSDEAQDLALWIRLEQTPGVGPVTARRLLTRFGLPHHIFGAEHRALLEVVPERIAQALVGPLADEAKDRIEKTLAWAAQRGNRVLTLVDVDYPKALLEIADPPIVLYTKGNPELLSRPSLAVVGSRNSTAQGVLNAEKFSESLSQSGYTIVSGMALGIDTAAHLGGLRGAGSTVAVIGTGINIVYPARNRQLEQRLAAEGCIVSEYPLDTPVVAANFPRRNRIISGLSQGVLVIEAAAQSGSLITARMAAEQGREVFAIPGSIHSPLSKGCHLLIKQGAKLVESAQDILEEIGQHVQPPAMQVQTSDAESSSPLLDVIGFDPVAIDVLAERCAIDMASLNAELLTLELESRIEMLPGGKIRRIATV